MNIALVEAMRGRDLSFTRIAKWETCPLSYRLHYIDRVRGEPGIPARFGSALHTVFERLLRELIEEERMGPLSEARAVELFRSAWAAEGLSGVALFSEGLDIIRRFIRDEGIVDHRNILAVEREFRLQVGPFRVIGFIDRVDCVDSETIKITDYKSNYQLFARDEVDTSLQLSLYQAAAHKLWPWAKKVQLAFWMVRHGVQQETSRTTEQIADALAYIEALGNQIQNATKYSPRLNANCNYCDYRKHCPAYDDALAGKREFIAEDLSDLKAVAREREQTATLAKLLYARKDELDKILKAHLQENSELVLGSTKYRMFNVTSIEYALEPTLAVLSQATGRDTQELLGELAIIDKKALDKLVAAFGKQLDKAHVELLKAELEAHATKHHSPRLWAKALKKGAEEASS